MHPPNFQPATWRDVRTFFREALWKSERTERVMIPSPAENYLSRLLADTPSRPRRIQRVLETPPKGMPQTFYRFRAAADHIVYNGIFIGDKLWEPWKEKAQEYYDGAYDIGRRHLGIPAKRVYILLCLQMVFQNMCL